MSVNDAITQLLEIEEKRKENVFAKDMMVVGCARIGSESPSIRYGKASELLRYDFGEPLHCLIIPGKLHFMEEEMVKGWVY
jgi:diphthine synthase